MKLKIYQFERFAREKGYRSGWELLMELGCSKGTYYFLRRGGDVGPDLAAEIYNRFGDEKMFEIIDFGDDYDRKKSKRPCGE